MAQKRMAWAGGAAAVVAVGLAASEWARIRTARRAARQGPQHRVVVVGAGFGGLQAALTLAEQPGIDLTVIDSHNHHLFQPLLYQVATAALTATDIASPIRGILTPSPRTRVLMEAVDGVDTAAGHVVCGGRVVPYDELIIATGSQPSYFGHGDWAKAAPSLKTLEDATLLRRRILTAFERSVLAETEVERRRLLTFVLIGGGATGVEMAGAIAELAHDGPASGQVSGAGRSHDHHHRGRGPASGVVRARPVGQRGGCPAPDGCHRPDRDEGHRHHGRHGADRHRDDRGGDDHLDSRHGGDAGRGLARCEGRAWRPGRSGRAPPRGGETRRACSSGMRPSPKTAGGKALPGLAPVAKQQGRYVARTILRRRRGLPAPGPFAYKDYGTLATIGRNKAVAEFGRLHLTGFAAWLIWAVAHIFFLISFRNRFMVAAQWAFAYVTHERGDRLLVGAARARPLPHQPPVAKPG